MKLTHFRDLLAIVRTGSLRAASRHLEIAQPVITRSIQQLEQELGISLLERTSKGVLPTPAGEAFVRRIEAVESEIQRARDEMAQWRGEDVGEVSMALSPIVCMTLMLTLAYCFAFKICSLNIWSKSLTSHLIAIIPATKSNLNSL